MHNSKTGVVATLAEIAGAQVVRTAVFFRSIWFAIRWFRRNKEYRNGIGEVVDGMPLPSARLISSVTGIPDIAWYLVSGKLSAEDVIGSLRKNRIHLCSLKTILDFGCGCARVTRHMFKLENSVIYGVDIDRDAIKWCKQQFSSDHFSTSSYEPQLDFPNSKFDLVYAVSVFTHLRTDLFLAWIEELRRVISPGGYLIFTTVGEKYLERLSNSERAQFNQGSPVVKTERYSSNNLCRAYHPYDFVSKKFKNGFTIVDFSAGAAKGTPGQDLYLFRKK